MPRKRRSSGRSIVSNKSPRKSNLNASSENEPEDEQPPQIVLEIDSEEWTLDPLEELACLSISGEENENENKEPFISNQGLSLLALNLGYSTPSKRASPLSPTLLENVCKPVQPTTAVPFLESDPNVTPMAASKTEITEESQALLSGGKEVRSKRRLNLSEKSISTAKSSNEISFKKVDQCQMGENPEGNTSQKPSDSNDRIPLPVADYRVLDDYHIEDAPPPSPHNYRKHVEKTKEQLCQEVLYELDELDICWLDELNKTRTQRLDGLNLGNVEYEEMELLLDRFEKENYFELQKSGMGQPGESDEDAVCCICLDGESDNSNLIIFCDMCNIPVHQDCYGVPFIPEGSWLCRRCSISPNAAIECVFCPNKDGAFKQTIDGRWAHVLCALWIPEVRFANPSLVEPVDDIDDIPHARWKLICFICKKKGAGACIQCHLRTCVTAFHATCAQAEGLSLKVETKESTGVRMIASCDKHTSARDNATLKQKIETINKVLDEKRAAPQEMQFPSISVNRMSAIAELVTFPGKHIFIKQLLAYWKLKRKSRGGAPLLRNLEAVYISDTDEPPAPHKLDRQHDPTLVTSCFEKMQELRTGLSVIQNYCVLIKNHSELQCEDLKLKSSIELMRLEAFQSSGVFVYLDILNKLATKDKHDTFAEPVTPEEAPDYFSVISNPMDLRSMREKVLCLEYSSIDELESDFLLMINNCMTYNKKSTAFYKDAVKLKEFGAQVFQEGRLVLESQSLHEDTDMERKPDTLVVKTDESDNTNNESMKPSEFTELKYHPLQGVLVDILEKLERHDKNGVFAEPVDVNELPDYLTIVKEPMDFSTMRNKINANQYSCIEDFERDYFLMINNCLEYNDENTRFYKLAEKLHGLGKNIFDESKHKHYMPGLMITEANNNYKTDTSDVVAESPVLKELTEQDMLQIMSEVLKQLIDKDHENIFLDPVTDEDAPGYSEIIESPMDLSLMEQNLKNSVYKCLEDLENHFNLMISNCKKYNSSGTLYHNYATKMKRVGNSIFYSARKELATYKTPKVSSKEL